MPLLFLRHLSFICHHNPSSRASFLTFYPPRAHVGYKVIRREAQEEGLNSHCFFIFIVLLHLVGFTPAESRIGASEPPSRRMDGASSFCRMSILRPAARSLLLDDASLEPFLFPSFLPSLSSCVTSPFLPSFLPSPRSYANRESTWPGRDSGQEEVAATRSVCGPLFFAFCDQ